MHIHAYERAWAYISIGLLVVFFLAIITAAFAAGVQLPSPQGYVDPADLTATDFAQPGLREVSPRNYELFMVAQTWAWVPNEIRIPTGSKLNIYITSRDVQHGFKIVGTDVNMMVIPGEVSHAEHIFDKPGDYLIVCHEYCGLGHHAMEGHIIVED